MDLFWEEHWFIVCNAQELSQCTIILLPWKTDPQMAGAMVTPYNCLQFILMSLSLKSTLEIFPSTMTLKVVTVDKIAVTSKTFTVHVGEPLSVIQQAHIIPEGQVFEPTCDVMVESIVKFDSMMKTCSLHRFLYQAVKKRLVLPTDTAIKVKFLYQEEDSMLGG